MISVSGFDADAAAAAAVRTKSEWRSELKRRLALISAESSDRRRAREERMSASISDIISKRPGTWLAFSPTASEPSLMSLYNSSPKRFAFPRMNAEHMSFHVWSENLRAAPWRDHRFGIREPDVEDSRWRPVSEAEIISGLVAGVLIPGMGFDRHLRRLGRGGGFYDRFLEGRDFYKVGVCFGEQLIDEVPHETHDAVLDAIVTDREVLWRMETVGAVAEVDEL